MNLSISYRHMDSSEALENKIKEKAEHLKKYFHGNVDIKWVCSIEKNNHISEVNVHAGSGNFHAHAEDKSMYSTLDLALAKIEKQVSKSNSKQKDNIHGHSKDKDIFYEI